MRKLEKKWMSLMKKQSLSLSSFLIFFFFINSSFSNSEDLKSIYGKAEVIDGDTIIINEERIRFGGIDAPESFYRGKKQACHLNEKKIFCGELSKEKLKEKIFSNNISCIIEKNKDRYGRTIAECFIDGESLSSFMVRNGYAFDYVRYSNKKYAQDQEYAKVNKLGMWNMKFEYPWEWRKKNK